MAQMAQMGIRFCAICNLWLNYWSGARDREAPGRKSRAGGLRLGRRCGADQLQVVPGFGQEGKLTVVITKHYPGLLAEIILVTAGKLTPFAIADKGYIPGCALVSNPVAGVDFLAGQVVRQVDIHKRRSLCAALAALKPGHCPA